MKTLSLLVSVSLVCGYPVWALEPVHIGICLPLSGHQSEQGHAALRAVKIAHRMRPNVAGKPVVLKIANTHSELADARAAVLSLVERYRVAAIITEHTLDSMARGMNDAGQRHIPIVAAYGTQTMRPLNGYETRVRTIDNDQACLAAGVARTGIRARTAGVVYDMSRKSSLDLSRCFKRAFERAGGTIVVETRVKRGDRDFTAQLHRLRAAQPDVIYAPIPSTECALFARQARAMGLKARIVAAHDAQVPQLIDLGGKSVEGLICTAHVPVCAAGTNRLDRFTAAFHFHTGIEPQPDQVMAAQAYFELLDAIEQAGSADLKGLREPWANATPREAIADAAGFSGSEKGSSRLSVNQVKNGKFVSYEIDDSLNR
jgi:branched-chain amino acid transport system substrate-binding protein